MIEYELSNPEDLDEHYGHVKNRFIFSTIFCVSIFALIDVLLANVKDANMVVFAFAENIVLLTFVILIATVTASIISKLQATIRNYNSEFRD